MEQAKAFIAKMQTDVTFRERIMTIEDVGERMKTIPMEGFDCTKSDIISLYTSCELAITESFVTTVVPGGGCCSGYCYQWT